MKKPRGDNQSKILDYIKNAVRDQGYPPSVREICDAVGLKSTSTVHGHLMRLQKKGLLNRDPMKPRAMEILGDPRFTRGDHGILSVPILGRVTAGTPILAQEQIDESLLLPQELLGGEGTHYILSVRGESMINAGILDGDLVVVKKQETANNGDIIVAMIEDEATVKRYYKENGHFRLQPENDTMQPILADEVTVLGKVVSLLRQRVM